MNILKYDILKLFYEKFNILKVIQQLRKSSRTSEILLKKFYMFYFLKTTYFKLVTAVSDCHLCQADRSLFSLYSRLYFHICVYLIWDSTPYLNLLFWTRLFEKISQILIN